MKKNRVSDRRFIRLEEISKEDYIPFLGGRPVRDTAISQDDVVNLLIALNTSRSLEEFADQV